MLCGVPNGVVILHNAVRRSHTAVYQISRSSSVSDWSKNETRRLCQIILYSYPTDRNTSKPQLGVHTWTLTVLQATWHCSVVGTGDVVCNLGRAFTTIISWSFRYFSTTLVLERRRSCVASQTEPPHDRRVGDRAVLVKLLEDWSPVSVDVIGDATDLIKEALITVRRHTREISSREYECSGMRW